MTSFTENLNNAARENPLAACLVGAGIAWMLFGPRSSSDLLRGIPRVVETVADTARAGTRSVMEAAEKTGGALVGAVSDTSEAVSKSFETTRQAVDTQTSAAHRSIHQTLPAIFEQQPLAVGVAGLVLGAAIASAFPALRVETELMGEVSATARKKLSAIADSAGPAAQAAMSAVGEEARRQGLSAEGLRDGVNQAVENVKDAISRP